MHQVASEEARQKIKASTSVSFFGKNSYLLSHTYSHIRTFGGPPYRINFTTIDWEDGIPNALMAIDREGMPLNLAVIPEVLTKLPPAQTLELADYIKKAIS